VGSTTLVVVIVIVALGFDYTNGFHDSANAIATAISTRALTPRLALMLAAVLNVVGALVSTAVAKTIGGGVIRSPSGHAGPASGFTAQTLSSGVLLATAQWGLPVSTTHVISASVMGVGATRRLSAVRWGVAGNIVVAWLLTIPAAPGMAALVSVLLYAID